MPGPLVSISVLALALRRLRQLTTALDNKIQVGAATTLEHRVRFLAREAALALEGDPPVPDQAGDLARLSRFAVFGSSGADVLAASAAFGPGRDWVYRTLHKGTPDEHREQVIAHSTDFVFTLWQNLSDSSAGTAESAQYRSYVLGYLTSIARSLVCNPFLDDYEWRLGPGRDAAPTLLPGSRGLLDARAAVAVLGAGSPREGQDWSRYWPAPQDVPAAFWDAFRAAFATHYGATPIRGSAEYEASQAGVAQRPLDAAFVQEAYQFYYRGVIGVEYGFGQWTWMGFFLPLAITFALELGLAPAFPRWRKMFTATPSQLTPDPAPPDDEIEADSDSALGWIDLFAYPTLAMGPAVLTYGILAQVYVGGGFGGLNTWGIVAGALLTIGLVVYVATIATKRSDFAPWLRALLFVILPLIGAIVFLVLAFTRGRTPASRLAAFYALPLIGAIIGFILYFLVFLPIGALAESQHASDTAKALLYVLFVVLVLVGLLIGWVYVSRWMREVFLPEIPDESITMHRGEALVSRLRSDRPGFARVFDESTLFQIASPAPLAGGGGAAPAAASPTTVARGSQFFPSGRRKLIKLWWEAQSGSAGALFVRSDRYSLIFADSAAGGNPRTVALPVGPLTVAELVGLLDQLSLTLGSLRAKLRASAYYPADQDYDLPPGATLSDLGDGATTTDEHDLQAARFAPIGTDPSAADVYVLSHAPKVAQSVRLGLDGAVPIEVRDAVPADIKQDRSIPGVGQVQSSGTLVTGTGTAFAEFFMVGDTLMIGSQRRTVTLITSQTSLTVASPFSPDVGAGSAYARLGGELERELGYRFGQSFAGEPSLLDRAGDVAAMLCMAAVPRLSPSAPTVPGLTNAPGGDQIAAIYQVFRNWNLDRRRVNEWRELVSGHAVVEPAAAFGAYGASPPPAFAPWRQAGATTAALLGWSDLLRRFTNGVQLGENFTDDTVAGAHPNLPPPGQHLSPASVARALAHLLDLPEPLPVSP